MFESLLTAFFLESGGAFEWAYDPSTVMRMCYTWNQERRSAQGLSSILIGKLL